MTALLLTLQIVGALLAAAAAAASLLKSKGIERTETPSPIIGGESRIVTHISREATVGIWCVLVGLLVAFGARITEATKASHDARLSQQHTSNQISNMTTQLTLQREAIAHLERLATRLDDLEVDMVCEFPSSALDAKPCFAQLRAALAPQMKFAPSAQHSGGTNGIFSPIFSMVRSPDLGLLGVNTDGTDTWTGLNIKTAFQNNQMNSLLPDADLHSLLEFIQRPMIVVLITPPCISSEADVVGFKASNPELLSVRTAYLPVRDVVRVKWSLIFHRRTWTYTGKIASIVDLTGASAFFHLCNAPRFSIPNLSLSYARANFNGVPLELWGCEAVNINQNINNRMSLPDAFVVRELRRPDLEARANGALFRALFSQRRGEIQEILFTPPYQRTTPKVLRLFDL